MSLHDGVFVNVDDVVVAEVVYLAPTPRRVELLIALCKLAIDPCDLIFLYSRIHWPLRLLYTIDFHKKNWQLLCRSKSFTRRELQAQFFS